MYRLIIADDEELIRTGLFCRIDWKSMGFDVVAMMEDGSDVLAFLEKERIDVLLTDICMYQVTGLEVARVVQEKYPWVKVVLLSGYREFEYAREAIRCGVYEYLLKPIDYGKLKSIFVKIKQELDQTAQEESLLKCFGEEEYDQVLQLIRLVTDSVMGEGEENWRAYARLKPVLRNSPAEIRDIVVKRMLKTLQTKLSQTDPALADEFSKSLKKVQTLQTPEALDSGLVELFQQLNDELVSRNLISLTRSEGNVYIQKARGYIGNHLGEDFTYKDVAEFVHLSPRHFIRLFRSETGDTFSDYVFRTRMEGAIRLLEENKIRPEDVGHAVGYHDEKYFQQLFRKYTGCSLSEYRRES